MRHLTRLLLGFGSAVLASLLFAAPVVAQVTTADITGRVLDQNGAAVASATITARNIGTGQERTVQSDQNGNYTLSELPPGTYDITVEAPNFSKAVIKARELNVGTTATLTLISNPDK